jgi:hypothetical protein
MDRICPNNTAVFTGDDGALTVVLHKTAVFKKYPDGIIELNSGGWRTVTTKNRINQAFRALTDNRFAVTQKDHACNYALIPFEDGMRLDPR